MSRVTPEVNTLLNLQVEQQAVRNDAQSHTLFILQVDGKDTKVVPHVRAENAIK